MQIEKRKLPVPLQALKHSSGISTRFLPVPSTATSALLPSLLPDGFGVGVQAAVTLLRKSGPGVDSEGFSRPLGSTEEERLSSLLWTHHFGWRRSGRVACLPQPIPEWEKLDSRKYDRNPSMIMHKVSYMNFKL